MRKYFQIDRASVGLALTSLIVLATVLCAAHAGAHADEDGTCAICTYANTPVGFDAPLPLPEVELSCPAPVAMDPDIPAIVIRAPRSRAPPVEHSPLS